MKLRLAGLTAAALVAAAIAAPAASATFHLMQIRELYPGSGASPAAEYVELQMWAPDQNLVAGHVLRTYDATGAPTGSDTFPADVPRAANQSTLVLATPEAEAELGFSADAALAPSGRLDPAGGAVCWETIDCVSWGSFSGSLPSAAGAPAAPAGIPAGMALRRTIAPGCATLLEPGDDHDSGADFLAVFPSPRPNSAPPSELPCAGAGGATGGGATGPAGHDDEAPGTTLRAAPPKRSRDRTPTFRFGSDQAGAGFECSLDRRPFRACRSPFTTTRLGTGRHTFRVRARNRDEVDETPAASHFRVLAPSGRR
ncbi:MAG TPA: hypothetical protein VGO36_03285 [Solirubrobacterales bacterium]|jgi:hypothetical protein|nr:hypothetical protein [Solirubrobacterales bacterium]